MSSTTYTDLLRRKVLRLELDVVLEKMRALQRQRITLERQLRDGHREQRADDHQRGQGGRGE